MKLFFFAVFISFFSFSSEKELNFSNFSLQVLSEGKGISWECSFNSYLNEHFKFVISQYGKRRRFDFFLIKKQGNKSIKVFSLIMDGKWWYVQEDFISKKFIRYRAYTAPFLSFPNAYYYLLASRPQFIDNRREKLLGSLVYDLQDFSYYQRDLSDIDRKYLYQKLDLWEKRLKEKNLNSDEIFFFTDET